MLLIATLVLGVMLVHLVTSRVSARANSGVFRIDEAIEIVRGRLARGEIDAAEYNRLVIGLTRSE
jgi:uncharacterized membrane protein